MPLRPRRPSALSARDGAASGPSPPGRPATRRSTRSPSARPPGARRRCASGPAAHPGRPRWPTRLPRFPSGREASPAGSCSERPRHARSSWSRRRRRVRFRCRLRLTTARTSQPSRFGGSRPSCQRLSSASCTASSARSSLRKIFRARALEPGQARADDLGELLVPEGGLAGRQPDRAGSRRREAREGRWPRPARDRVEGRDASIMSGGLRSEVFEVADQRRGRSAWITDIVGSSSLRSHAHTGLERSIGPIRVRSRGISLSGRRPSERTCDAGHRRPRDIACHRVPSRRADDRSAGDGAG